MHRIAYFCMVFGRCRGACDDTRQNGDILAGMGLTKIYGSKGMLKLRRMISSKLLAVHENFYFVISEIASNFSSNPLTSVHAL